MITTLPFCVDYAGESDNCATCRKLIGEGRLKLGIVELSPADTPEAKWYHERCFCEIRRIYSVDFIDGFANLRYSDQLTIDKMLYIGLEKHTDEHTESKIQSQTIEFHEIRDKLKTITMDDQIELLKLNHQHVPEQKSEVICGFTFGQPISKHM